MTNQSTRTDNQIDSIPFERPKDWIRRRDAPKPHNLLPYFIAGPENRLSAFVSESLAKILPDANPLLLTGTTGTGKTSIALLIAARISQLLNKVTPECDLITSEVGASSEPISNVLYMTSNDFHREYSENVAADILQSMRETIQQSSIWIVEDLHHLQEKYSAQEELALRIEGRTLANKPTLLTSNLRPSEIAGMKPDFCSRCVEGLTIPLQYPGYEASRQIITELSMRHDLTLDDESILHLLSLSTAKSSVRELDSILRSLVLWSKVNDAPLTLDAITNTYHSASHQQPITLSRICALVAKHFNIKRSDIRSHSRKQSLVRARSLAMLIARKFTTKTMMQIGDYFGGRDHTTVLHAIRTTEQRLKKDRVLSEAMEKIELELVS